MSVKSELRKELIAKRRVISDKAVKDDKISSHLLESRLYSECSQVLFYAALEDEINLDRAIGKALLDGKRVALPRCTDKNGNMSFYYIDSLTDLQSGAFGVREPVSDEVRLVTDFTSAICIVPALSFDLDGYRIGYGKGYYDRFLQKYSSISIGLCYNELISEKIPTDKFDLPVDYIITENGIISV